MTNTFKMILKNRFTSSAQDALEMDKLLDWDRLVYGYSRYGEPAMTRGAVLSKIVAKMYQSFRIPTGSGKTVSQHATFNWQRNRVDYVEKN